MNFKKWYNLFIVISAFAILILTPQYSHIAFASLLGTIVGEIICRILEK